MGVLGRTVGGQDEDRSGKVPRPHDAALSFGTNMIDSDNVAELTRSLVRARKNLRMYPDGHPMHEKTINDFCAFMSRVLEDQSYTLRINQYDILHEDSVVYHSRDREESLSLFFFKDGLRELTFLKGMSHEEIKDFLEIISLDFEKVVLDDDIVTLLWERDFQHIRYVVDDAILYEGDAYERDAAEQAKSACVGNGGIIKAFEDVRKGSGSMSGTEVFPLSDEDIRRISEEMENDRSEKATDLVCMLFEMFSLAGGREECEDIARCMKETLNYALTTGCTDAMNRVLNWIRSAEANPSCSREEATAVRMIRTYISSSPFISLLGDVMTSRREMPRELLDELSLSLSAEAVPHLIEVLGESETIPSRRAIIYLLTELGRRDMKSIAARLGDKRWYVVRNVIYVLRRIGDTGAAAYIVHSASHRDTRVRKEAVRALGELGAESSLDALQERMHDEADTVRVAAFAAIGRIGTVQAKKMILAHASTSQFRECSFPEKKELLRVLARWGDSDVVSFLTRMVKRRALFKRARNNETRAAALHSLGIIGDGAARPLIERFRKSGNRLLRAEAQEILNRS
ncbi:MAG: HEAT repeat domain-containing protein [Nitrospiraceae bacterium]|nr:MAG: HEAT repeat domain-containing protein [Nitrospiraceae bacterium]